MRTDQIHRQHPCTDPLKHRFQPNPRLFRANNGNDVRLRRHYILAQPRNIRIHFNDADINIQPAQMPVTFLVRMPVTLARRQKKRLHRLHTLPGRNHQRHVETMAKRARCQQHPYDQAACNPFHVHLCHNVCAKRNKVKLRPAKAAQSAQNIM